jgi:hypothetical protein
MTNVHRGAALVLSAAAAFTPACTGLEPAALTAGASAAETGVTFFVKGKARSFEVAGFEDALTAMRRAGDELAFRLDEEEITDRRARLVYFDENHTSIVVVVERRTLRVTMLQTDVGTFGPPGLATVLLNRAQSQLKEMGAYAEPPLGGNSQRP